MGIFFHESEADHFGYENCAIRSFGVAIDVTEIPRECRGHVPRCNIKPFKLVVYTRHRCECPSLLGDEHKKWRSLNLSKRRIELLTSWRSQVTVRSLPEWRRKYAHLMMRRGRKTAKVAMARRLAVRLYWMMRQGWDYQQWSNHLSGGFERYGDFSTTTRNSCAKSTLFLVQIAA